MMVFFTPYFKKLNHYACFSIVLLLLSSASVAYAASSININYAELQSLDDSYSLSADINIDFDNEIEEAVNKGVPLNFLIEFQIVKPWKYWFDDEIVTVTKNITLSYHALSRQYLVSNGAHQKSFETLHEAKDALMQINDWKVINKSLIEKSEAYNAALLMRLDQSKLPKAIQVDAIGSEKWNLTSQKYEWALKDANSTELNSLKASSVKELE